MVRKETWRQDSPQMQVGALLASVQGNLNNFLEGLIPAHKQQEVLERMAAHLSEAQEIARQLPNTDWCVERNRK